MVKNFRRLLICALILVLSFVGAASATTWTVDGDGEADFTGIQDAVDVANACDTIIVHSGTYYENVDVNKQLILRGLDTGGGKPVVDAGGSDNAITLCRADGITLEGFTAINAASVCRPAGIKIVSS